MTNKRIPDLTAATTPLAGTELVPVWNGTATVKVTVDYLTRGRYVYSLGQYINGDITQGNGGAADIGKIWNDAGWYSVRGDYANVNGLKIDAFIAIRTDINGAEVGRFVSTGYKPISGKGLDFSNVTPAAGMTSKVLTNYEEGTWTPALSASTSGTITINSASGLYTRIGRQVTVTGYVDITSVAAPIGSLLMTGLPFACGSALGNRSAVSVHVTGLAATAVTSVVGRIVAGESQLRIDKYSAGSTAAMAADVINTTVFHFSATYFA